MAQDLSFPGCSLGFRAKGYVQEHVEICPFPFIH